MADLVTCPGCSGEVDRDELFLCPTCHADLINARPTALTVPEPLSNAAPVSGSTDAAQDLGSTHADDGSDFGAASRAAQVTETWVCLSPGCRGAAPISSEVEICPLCFEPRRSQVVDPATPAEFELCDVGGDVIVRLSGAGPWTLGRDLIGVMTVSRSHALISRHGSALVIRDLNSSNHTFVDRIRLQGDEERIVELGGTIGLGRSVVLHVRAV
jgi:hypothetical protein